MRTLHLQTTEIDHGNPEWSISMADLAVSRVEERGVCAVVRLILWWLDGLGVVFGEGKGRSSGVGGYRVEVGLLCAFAASSLAFLHSSAEASIEVCSKEHEVVIALGSNIGNRIENFNQALHLMKKLGINITRHGCLYETDPAYVTDQPKFLNSL
uniref:2-amino-4-hydroxy-6-hydroxymethyldihydropteridine diphosphokinase n=1 Tax=Chenopodium quinoa TaxID=63459 RepID=A0A803L7R0_CHEQI